MSSHSLGRTVIAYDRVPRDVSGPSCNAVRTLASLFEFAADAGLFDSIPAGSTLYRARSAPDGRRYRDATELGPPPIRFATQTNRMSPPGIVMMYASEDRATALAEIADAPGRYAVGRFATRRDATVLDVSRRLGAPTIFEPMPDTMRYDPRPRLIFLQEVARDISRPIGRDDRAHVDYVPTQVVTEYLRTMTTVDGRGIDGIRYRSSRRNATTSLVLFATQDDMILPERLRPDLYGLTRDSRWIELTSARSIEVNAAMIALGDASGLELEQKSA